MKAISIQQPWAQLVASGYKRIIHTTNLPFDVPERVLIYASGYDPLAENDGELLPPLVRMQLENAKLLGYLTDDELPTRALLGSVEVVGWNDREGQPWKGVDEDGADSQDYLCLGDAKLFYDPIKLENVNGSRVFDVISLSDNLPPSFKLNKICRNEDVLTLPCTYDFSYDIHDVEEYTYSLYVLYNNKFLLCDEVNGTLIPKPTKYVQFKSQWTTYRFRVVDCYLEPSPFDKSVSQIVFKLRALDKSDFDNLPQPLAIMAKVAADNSYPVKLGINSDGNLRICSDHAEFSTPSAIPDYVCFFNSEDQTVELLFTSQIDCTLPQQAQEAIIKKHVNVHFPFNVQWNSRYLSMCGMVFIENNHLSEDVAKRFFNSISNAANSLAEELDLGF